MTIASRRRAAALVALLCWGLQAPAYADSERLEEFAFLVRAEGALFGNDALVARFGAEGLDPSNLLEDPALLPAFLGASTVEVLCVDAELPVIAYLSPIHRRAWLTRWERDGLRFRGARVTDVAGPFGEGARHWVLELLDGVDPDALSVRFEAELEARRTTLQQQEPEFCPPASAIWQDNERNTLTDPVERGTPLSRLVSDAGPAGSLHWALEDYFREGDAESLRALVPEDQVPLVPDAEQARWSFVPVYFRPDVDTLILYADLSTFGRYLLVATTGQAADPDVPGTRLQGLSLQVVRVPPFQQSDTDRPTGQLEAEAAAGPGTASREDNSLITKRLLSQNLLH
jgi:hypothetical protein